LVDSEDTCPNSPEGATIDVFGCEVFDLPAANFSIMATAVTCNGVNDGYISISSQNVDYTYNISVAGASSGTLSSSNGFSLDVENLSAGTYRVCITIEGRDNYEQCYEVIIDGPSPITAYSSLNRSDKTISFSLSGAKNYKIVHNGKLTITDQSQVEIDLKAGMNKISISTDSECQGIIDEEVFISEKVVLFPNPTKGNLQVYVGGEESTVNVTLIGFNGQTHFSMIKEVSASRIVDLDLTNYNRGIYNLLLESKTVKKSIKLIKE